MLYWKTRFKNHNKEEVLALFLLEKGSLPREESFHGQRTGKVLQRQSGKGGEFSRKEALRRFESDEAKFPEDPS